MTDHWWTCETCGHELYDSRELFLHRRDTGHPRAQLTTKDVPPGPGSTARHRAAVLEQVRRQLADAKRHTQEPQP